MENKLLGTALMYLVLYHTYLTDGTWPEESTKKLISFGFMDEGKKLTDKFHSSVADFLSAYGNDYI